MSHLRIPNHATQGASCREPPSNIKSRASHPRDCRPHVNASAIASVVHVPRVVHTGCGPSINSLYTRHFLFNPFRLRSSATVHYCANFNAIGNQHVVSHLRSYPFLDPLRLFTTAQILMLSVISTSFPISVLIRSSTLISMRLFIAARNFNAIGNQHVISQPSIFHDCSLLRKF